MLPVLMVNTLVWVQLHVWLVLLDALLAAAVTLTVLLVIPDTPSMLLPSHARVVMPTPSLLEEPNLLVRIARMEHSLLLRPILVPIVPLAVLLVLMLQLVRAATQDGVSKTTNVQLVLLEHPLQEELWHALIVPMALLPLLRPNNVLLVPWDVKLAPPIALATLV